MVLNSNGQLYNILLSVSMIASSNSLSISCDAMIWSLSSKMNVSKESLLSSGINRNLHKFFAGDISVQIPGNRSGDNEGKYACLTLKNN